ncbi:MAG: hypothetical protein A2W85_14600 [Bacteroidetes bacterium GWF2_41_31]|nr:MAG: hypothetical protein A2W85_14600 [Bacteroidetes bacterium GWF2_41_31]
MVVIFFVKHVLLILQPQTFNSHSKPKKSKKGINIMPLWPFICFYIKINMPLWLILIEDGIRDPEARTIRGHEKLTF